MVPDSRADNADRNDCGRISDGAGHSARMGTRHARIDFSDVGAAARLAADTFGGIDFVFIRGAGDLAGDFGSDEESVFGGAGFADGEFHAGADADGISVRFAERAGTDFFEPDKIYGAQGISVDGERLANAAILIVPVIMQSLILDLSRTETSTRFVAELEGGGIFQRVRNLNGTSEISEAIDSGAAILVVTIAPDFERELIQKRAGKIQVITDGRNTMTASVASGYVGRIVDEFNGGGAGELQTVGWYNPNLITRWDFLPGLMGLLNFIQVMLLAGLSVARERDQGTFDQLLVTPLAPWQILIGKMVAPVVIGVFQATLVFLVCRFFPNPVHGNVADGFAVGICDAGSQHAGNFADADFHRPAKIRAGLPAEKGCTLSDAALNFVPRLIVAAVTLPVAVWLFRNKLS